MYFKIRGKVNLTELLPIYSKNAKVQFKILEFNKTFDFKEVGNGIYNCSIDTTLEEFHAFLSPQLLTGRIIIEKDIYEVKQVETEITIGMVEIFPKFPLFYFLLIISLYISLVGAITINRLIDYLRMPDFVKKVKILKKCSDL